MKLSPENTVWTTFGASFRENWYKSFKVVNLAQKTNQKPFKKVTKTKSKNCEKTKHVFMISGKSRYLVVKGDHRRDMQVEALPGGQCMMSSTALGNMRREC